MNQEASQLILELIWNGITCWGTVTSAIWWKRMQICLMFKNPEQCLLMQQHFKSKLVTISAIDDGVASDPRVLNNNIVFKVEHITKFPTYLWHLVGIFVVVVENISGLWWERTGPTRIATRTMLIINFNHYSIMIIIENISLLADADYFDQIPRTLSRLISLSFVMQLLLFMVACNS